MKAFRLLEPGHTGIAEVPTPTPGSGEVLLRVGSASFCHSDVALVALQQPFFSVPVTLGHEIAGTVVEVGSSVDGWETGTEVGVHIIQGCGACVWCVRGQDNRCVVGSRTPGVHFDGGVAEYVVVPARSLVALDGVKMIEASALTDAGLTAYHAVDLVRDLLNPNKSALVIGIGGLGHLGIQIVAVSTGATIYAVDTDPKRLDLARRLGAQDAFVAGDGTLDALRSATGGAGVDVVLDFVGSTDSLELAARSVHSGGAIVVTGLGGGHIGMSTQLGGPPGPGASAPSEVRLIRSFAGGMDDLRACLSLARRGLLHVETTVYPLEDAGHALDALVEGQVMGRAVIVP
jgi:alcohol dehydrogenase, propanol-preferring